MNKKTKYKIAALLVTTIISFSTAALAVERDATFETGYYYLNNKRFDDALTVFWRLAGNGDPRAQYYMGMMKDSGIGTSQDIFGGVRWIKKAAQQNYGPAIAFMGDACKNGHGTTRNLPEAFEWYEKAAKLGDAHSQNELGMLLRNGIKGHDKDINRALILFNTAAKQGYPGAYLNLGKLYSEGLGVEKDYKKAIELFRTAANNGNVDALYELGEFYYQGIGGFKSRTAALKYYFTAATQGHSDSMLKLGKMYEASDGDPSKGPVDAAIWYQKAIDKKNVEALYRLGALHEAGKGVEQDYKKAFDLYKKSYDRGSEEAGLALARLYEDGNGVSQNLNQTRNIYQKAAKTGNPIAMLETGRLYRYGIGGAKDFIEAYKWFALAAKFLDDEEKKAAAVVARIETTNNLAENDLNYARKAVTDWKPSKKRK